jgi:hypothetical protein
MMNERKKPIQGDNDTGHSQSFELALDIVGAISDAGFSLLPLEPSKAMQEAGAKIAGVSTATAYKIYRAMCKEAAKEWDGALSDPLALFDQLLKGEKPN